MRYRVHTCRIWSPWRLTRGGVDTLHPHFAKCFSCLKNLHLTDIFLHPHSLSRGWDVMLLALQTLKKLELTLNRFFDIQVDAENTLASLSFDLGRFPALRHFKFEQQCSFLNFLRLLTRLLSIHSSPIGIEVLEIRMTWFAVKDGHGKDLFSSDAGWSTLDKVLTSQRFVSLRKVVVYLELHMAWSVHQPPPHILELERNLTLPHVNSLFPLFRASNTQRTLEIHLKVGNIKLDLEGDSL